MATGAEITLNQSATAFQMANEIFGDGVTVTGASYSGSSYSSAIYSNGDTITPGVTPGDRGVLLSTGSVANFTRPNGDPNRSGGVSTNSGGANNRPDFNAIAGASTYDASYLDITFIPTGSVMSIQFVFASDEYPEYSSSVYNDSVGVWSNGVHVPLSITGGATAVGGVNQNENINLYNDNTGDAFNTEMDGFTVTMTLTIPVNAGVTNTLRIGIADTADSNYDSNLLIAGDSLQTTLIANQDDYTMQQNGFRNLDVRTNDTNATSGTLEVTHINGVAVMTGDVVTLPTGQVVTLKADGTFDVQNDSDLEKISFTYGVQSVDGSGTVLQDDVGFVTIDTIPCFVAGTSIRTMTGEVPVEDLELGDLVMTLDDGAQPVRWIGSRKVPAVGKLAPVRIRAGTFGAHGTLNVSPQHRVLVQDAQAEMLFGEDQVLVAAKDLVNDKSVRQIEGGEVEYVHILFDRHQVVWSEGLATESFLPGPQTTALFEKEIVDEICEIFPELDATTGKGYGPAARRTLRQHEAQVLFGRAS